MKIDYENHPSGILVEDRTTTRGGYISFEDYLAGIPKEYDRRLEELNINKVLGVYDERKK